MEVLLKELVELGAVLFSSSEKCFEVILFHLWESRSYCFGIGCGGAYVEEDVVEPEE